jgi:CspA family cold shock protein
MLKQYKDIAYYYSIMSSSIGRNIGRVKWFNSKAGYGFITLDDKDIFVHHSDVNVSNEQYKYLVQGEYVEFTINTTQEGTHDCKAIQVSGINGGKLMCETRNEYRQMKSTHESSESWKIAQSTEDSEQVPTSSRAPSQAPSRAPSQAPTRAPSKGRGEGRSGGRGGAGRGGKK